MSLTSCSEDSLKPPDKQGQTKQGEKGISEDPLAKKLIEHLMKHPGIIDEIGAPVELLSLETTYDYHDRRYRYIGEADVKGSKCLGTIGFNSQIYMGEYWGFHQFSLNVEGRTIDQYQLNEAMDTEGYRKWDKELGFLDRKTFPHPEWGMH